MATRNKSGEYLTVDERRLLESCYRCICNGCRLRREAIAKALRIIYGDTHVGEGSRKAVPKEDESL